MVIKVLIVVAIIKSPPLGYLFNHVANCSLFHLRTNREEFCRPLSFSENYIILLGFIHFWLAENAIISHFCLDRNFFINVSKLFAQPLDELKSQRKLTVNNLQVLVWEPDCFRNWVEVAIDVGTENCRVKANESIFDGVPLFLQKHNYVVQTQAQVISILRAGKHSRCIGLVRLRFLVVL